MLPGRLREGAKVSLVRAGRPVRGTVRFVGLTHFAPGMWVGVELERKAGKSNGSVAGVSYFVCKPRYGVFVRPDAVRLQLHGGARPPHPGRVITSPAAVASVSISASMVDAIARHAADEAARRDRVAAQRSRSRHARRTAAVGARTDSGGAHALPLLPREAVDPRGAVPAHKRRYHASMQATKFKVGDFVKAAYDRIGVELHGFVISVGYRPGRSGLWIGLAVDCPPHTLPLIPKYCEVDPSTPPGAHASAFFVRPSALEHGDKNDFILYSERSRAGREAAAAAAIDAAAEALLDDVDADADSLLSNVPSFCSDSAGDGSEHRPPPPADWSFSSSDDEYAPVPVAAGLSGALPQ
ncbi:dynactin [Thecamonas trahens ATCC 50062]|uniref:Dynactin n=1 Tax=Thecamonas trahens ATCC 50062 TaxID=461836 RepID=A0A0L0D6D1_THETB|nr:dynactin [Thecamonas trahens ATCC 50062]KNC47616.1 dynactin [Thecamonas trahens ATCC 50062]|eukprot:XP_013759541.1 dynactin [Thecamonas trahens ATCC 50062]